MSEVTAFLAVDIGASSGRVMAGQWNGVRFNLRELHRFPNEPIEENGHLHWDAARLWQEIQSGIAGYAAHDGRPLAGIGIDTWGVDFALLDEAGQLLSNPYHYRDQRTDGMPDLVERQVSQQRIYAQTGIQRMPINTLYQLFSMREQGDPKLDAAKTLLLMPDVFHFWLTGQQVAEYTNASTTQFLHARERRWATELLQELALPTHILPQVVMPGTILGELRAEVRAAVGLNQAVPVIASASHDTASAVAAIPGLDASSAYISSGTWSLVGVEIPEPNLSERARLLNFTNEGGVSGTIRLLKNVGGLWLLQECQRQWQREGKQYSWPELVALADTAPPLRSLVDPDAPGLLHPTDMPAAIRTACEHSAQPQPTTVGAVVRCCIESLALKYRWVIESLEQLTGRPIETIRIVGGGSQNHLLCQLTADACHKRVVAGPAEATALGNMLVQAIATGHLSDLAAGRQAIAASVQQAVFEPKDSGDWDAAFVGFEGLVRAEGP